MDEYGGAYPGNMEELDAAEEMSDELITLTPDEWAILNTVPEFAKLLDCLQTAYDEQRQVLADGYALVEDDAQHTAIRYAVMCARLEVLNDLLVKSGRKQLGRH